MPIEIREIEKTDYDAVLRMLAEIAALHHRGRPDLFAGGGAKYTHADLDRLTAAPDKRIFVAGCSERRCAGYLFCQINADEPHPPRLADRTLWIDDLYVDPACRRDGVGRALMAHAEAFAREQSCARVELNVWRFNDAAVAFYESCGMRVQRQIMELAL